MNLYEFTVLDIHKKEVKLADFQGKVVVVVNTASKCGLTPQYEGLEKLYQEFKEEGLEILGFPCNQFMGQEPGSNEDIQSFCSLNYGVTFPLFDKVKVNGKDADPLFQWLTKQQRGLLKGRVKWNFTKFLINANGEYVKRFEPTVTPAEMRDDIVQLLKQ